MISANGNINQVVGFQELVYAKKFDIHSKNVPGYLLSLIHKEQIGINIAYVIQRPKYKLTTRFAPQQIIAFK